MDNKTDGAPPVADTELEAKSRELRSIRRALDKSAIVAITDVRGNIIHTNDKFCEISKYSREELIGKNHRVVKSGYHPKEFFVSLWKTISSGNIWEGEIRNRAKDGTNYWVYTTIVPSLNSSGKPYEYVSIRYEITQKKLAEEKLKLYAARLEASNEELQNFATVAAHDLQEPLRKIQAFGERLKTKGKDLFTPELTGYVDRIHSSAERMRRLIDDLLSYSRVSSRAQPFEPVSLGQIMQEVLGDLEVRIEQTGAQARVGSLPTVDADPAQIRQLFQNLLSNAMKFQSEGVAPEIDVSAIVAGDRCTLTVKDNGIGFDEKYLDRIFKIFQRLHGRFEYEGTGIGLAICRRIVERHSGTLTAKSVPGKGATFIAELPLRQQEGNKSHE